MSDEAFAVYIADILVAPDDKRQGIGRTLAEALLEHHPLERSTRCSGLSGRRGLLPQARHGAGDLVRLYRVHPRPLSGGRSGPITRARPRGWRGRRSRPPDAAPWVTDFPNAAYYARPEGEREIDDLRLAFCARLHLLELDSAKASPDRPAGSTAPSGRRRFRRDGGRGRPAARRPPRGRRPASARGSRGLRRPGTPRLGIVFESALQRVAHRPGRMAQRQVGELTPSSAAPGRRVWKTYEPVPVADVDLVMGRPRRRRRPDFGSDRRPLHAAAPRRPAGPDLRD